MQDLTVRDPELWSLEQPVLYEAVTIVESGGNVVDNYETVFGIRTFRFDGEKGFLLNGNQVVVLRATSDGLQDASITLQTK